MSEFKTQRVEPNGLNGASSSIAPSAESKAFKKVFDSIIQLSGTHEFSEVTRVFSQIDQQKRHIQEKHTQLDENQAAIKVLTTQYHDLENESSKIQGDNDALQKIIAEKDNILTDKSEHIEVMQNQIGKLKSQIKDYHKEFTKYQNIEKEKDILKQQLGLEREKIQSLHQEKLSLSATIASTDEQLQKLIGFTAKQSTETESSVMDRFSQLWDLATQEIWVIFQENIMDESLNFWETFSTSVVELLPEAKEVPLIASNSDAAKGIRLAVVLAIISKLLVEEIFQPFYLTSDKHELKEVFANIAYDDPEKETFARSLFLSIEQEDQQEERMSRAERIVALVSKALFGILTNAQYERFRKAVQNIVQEAIKTWLPIQSAGKKYEATFEFRECIEKYLQVLQIFKENQNLTIRYDDCVFVIFPAISLIENNTENILHSCTMLSKSQKLYQEAEKEKQATEKKDIPEPSSPTNGRARGKRRPSNASQARSLLNGDSNGRQGKAL